MYIIIGIDLINKCRKITSAQIYIILKFRCHFAYLPLLLYKQLCPCACHTTNLLNLKSSQTVGREFINLLINFSELFASPPLSFSLHSKPPPLRALIKATIHRAENRHSDFLSSSLPRELRSWRIPPAAAS